MGGDSTSGTERRRPVVGVLGGGSEPLADDVEQRCHELGELIARRGWHLLTGGGRGVMAAVARAFVAVEGRAGLSLGILPGDADTGEPPAGYPNPFVEVTIRTHLPARGERGESPESRNHLNVLSADALIALPGGAGTASEVRLAIRYGRPVIGLATASELRSLPSTISRSAAVVEVDGWLESILGGRPSERQNGD